MEMNYTEAVVRLEKIMADIQNGTMDIDNLSERLAEAQRLIDFCRSRLFKVDEDITALLAGMDTDTAPSEEF